MSNRLLLVDGNNLCFKVRFSRYPADEVDRIKDVAKKIGATHLIAVFDDLTPEKDRVVNFRKKLYPEYKEGRQKPEDMEQYIQETHEALKSFCLTLFVPGQEADDVIATLAHKFPGKTVILSEDRDFYQLVDKNVVIVNTRREDKVLRVVNVHSVIRELGIKPEQVVSYKALIGDTADNFKGVPKIGPVKAKSLLTEYSSIVDIYKNIKEIDDNLAKLLIEGKNSASLSYKLAKLRKDLPIEINWEFAEVF